MPSPFKFLNAYTREDRDQFFGREEETAQLYELVNQNRLVLLYGPSGTGKTSLIQCGLGNRFEATDWLPLFIRRGGHLPGALQKALTDLWDEELDGNFWEADSPPLPRIIEDLFAEYLRPIYLVFDQLEELFILGDAEEQRIFTRAMADIYHAKLPCRLLFVLREEYLAHLYDFEQQIPTLFRRRLRVEAMSARQAEEVVLRSCQRFHITLEDPVANPVQIVSKVSAGRSGVALPYLQVYLDRLYREDFARTYPQAALAADAQPDTQQYPLEFTSAEIEQFGEISDVLKAFLQEQSQQIQAELRQRFPALPDRAVRKLLNAFTTLQGTKVPRQRSELQVPPLSDAQVDAILERLQQARILREEEGRYELAHDTLAGEIANQRSGAEQALLEIAELVHNRHRAFERTGTWLDAKELQLIEPYEASLREEQKLSEAQWAFVADSQGEARRKKRSRKLLVSSVIGGLSVLLLLAGWQWQEAEIAKSDAEKARNQALQNEQTALAAQEAAEQERDRADAERTKTLRTLIDVYRARLQVIANDYNEARDQIESGRVSELPPAIMQKRQARLNQVRAEQKTLQTQLDSLQQTIRP
jgi:hypothetical protein